MITRRSICLLAVASASLVACAGRPASTATTTAAPTAEPAQAATVSPQGGAVPMTAGTAATSTAPKRKSSGAITADELAHESIASLDAYAAVQRLRPSFLTSRGAVSLAGGGGGVMVSVDRSPPTSLAVLRSMRAAEIKEISYLSASEAGQRFGTAAGNAAVLLVTRR